MVVISGKNLTKHFSFAEYSVNQTGTVKLTEESILHAVCLEEFRKWLNQPMKVNAWYRTEEYNQKVGGNANSSHLRGCATDWGMPGLTKNEFIKYSKKWKAICASHGIVGEAGLYKWGMHLGSSIQYSKKFYHWDSRTGKQINMPFSALK
jgi:hypothetical protein|nr:MAG TPA: peptidase [Caudoviricetes sp.]